jgi:hypothetical protein
MCLACEMDALWFAEMVTATGVPPGTAAVPSAPENDPAHLAPASLKRAGETPALPGFRCEETSS